MTDADLAKANRELEEAIGKYFEAKGLVEDGEIFTGWVVVAESVMSTSDAQPVTIGYSDGLSITRQLGLIEFASTRARATIGSYYPGDDGDDDE